MARFFRLLILPVAASLLAGCYHRERVTITVSDLYTKEPLPNAEVHVIYPYLFELGPQQQEHITDANGSVNTTVAKYRAVDITVHKPGYVIFHPSGMPGPQRLTYFTQCEEWLQDRAAVIDPQRDESGWRVDLMMVPWP